MDNGGFGSNKKKDEIPKNVAIPSSSRAKINQNLIAAGWVSFSHVPFKVEELILVLGESIGTENQ